jgi:NAD(P)-dependent dehydrogenase (short-subunit alcohol dehydrogenase family)
MPSILITGAQQGLGLGLAGEFLHRGWHVTATVLRGADRTALLALESAHPSHFAVAEIDVTDGAAIEPFLAALGERRFDVVFSNAGIWGRLDQDLMAASDEELARVMLTNCFGPVRLARRLIDRLVEPGGTLAFMTSHRASLGLNEEGGLDLYRPSKAALNMLAKSTWATNRDRNLTVLLIHPGWVATDMGTLGGTVAAEIELPESVRGMAEVVERHSGSGAILYRDYRDRALPW